MSQWQTIQIGGVELRLDCFSQGSFTWCVRVVSSPQNLGILPPFSKIVKNIFIKGNFITYSNYIPLVLSLDVYLKEYLSHDREFLPFFFFFKHTFDADDVAGKYLYVGLHNLQVDQNLHSNARTMKNAMP